MNNEFNRMFLAESRVSSLAKAFAVPAILITISGAFILASYTAEQGTKEVGTRKVLGTGERQVVALFAWYSSRTFWSPISWPCHFHGLLRTNGYTDLPIEFQQAR
ncbi:MAG: hypothetical protein ABI416_09790 [Ginsengibacter sp.]